MSYESEMTNLLRTLQQEALMRHANIRVFNIQTNERHTPEALGEPPQWSLKA